MAGYAEFMKELSALTSRIPFADAGLQPSRVEQVLDARLPGYSDYELYWMWRAAVEEDLRAQHLYFSGLALMCGSESLSLARTMLKLNKDTVPDAPPGLDPYTFWWKPSWVPIARYEGSYKTVSIDTASADDFLVLYSDNVDMFAGEHTRPILPNLTAFIDMMCRVPQDMVGIGDTTAADEDFESEATKSFINSLSANERLIMW